MNTIIDSEVLKCVILLGFEACDIFTKKQEANKWLWFVNVYIVLKKITLSHIALRHFFKNKLKR